MTNPLSGHDIGRLSNPPSLTDLDDFIIYQNGTAYRTRRECRSYVGSTVSVTSSTTLVNVPGLSATVIPGATYAFRAVLPTTSGASGGTKAALGGTSTWTSINTSSLTYTASAVAVNQGTTATPGTSIAGATASNILTILEGTVVINAAGTLTVMFAQNASNGTASVVLANANFTVVRIA